MERSGRKRFKPNGRMKIRTHGEMVSARPQSRTAVSNVLGAEREVDRKK